MLPSLHEVTDTVHEIFILVELYLGCNSALVSIQASDPIPRVNNSTEESPENNYVINRRKD